MGRARAAYGGAVSEDQERIGVRVGIAAYLIWGLLTIYWKQLSAFDALELIGWRMLTAAVVMVVITTIRGTWPAITAAFQSRAIVGRLVVAALLLTANWGSFGCASVAVVILTVGAGQPPWISLVLAATWSCYALSKRNIPLGAIDSLTGETLVLFLPAAGLLIALSSSVGSAVDIASSTEWAFLLGTGLITAVPLMLFASAAQSIPFTLLGPLNLLVPVINFGLGWAVYDEPMPLNRLIGFAFVWMALIVVMTDRIREAHRRNRVTVEPVTAQ